MKLFTVLQMTFKGHSRSLQMTPFDRPYTTSCQSSIVSIPLSLTVLEILDVDEFRELEV